MSDLNKKNINYGALNRFYQDLKNHDLSGLATEEYVDDAIAEIPQLEAGQNISIDDNKINAIGYKAGNSISSSFAELPEVISEPYTDMSSQLPSTDLYFTGDAGATQYTVSGQLVAMLGTMVGMVAFQVGSGNIAKLLALDSTNNTVTLDKSLDDNNALSAAQLSKLYMVIDVQISGDANVKTYSYVDSTGGVFGGMTKVGAKIKIGDYALRTVTDKTNNTITFDETLDAENAVSNVKWMYSVNINNNASGVGSHAEGSNTTASGADSHAEGSNTTASGVDSHAEGQSTTASGADSHAEGQSTTASGADSHAEGYGTTASGGNSHAEGSSATASGDDSHAEGISTVAEGNYSHAEGYKSQTSGKTTAFAAHAEGSITIAQNYAEHAQGTCNVSHKANNSYGNSGNTQHSIGIGTNTNSKKNAFEVMQNGDMYVLGVGGYQGTDTKVQDAAIKTLQEYIASLETRIAALENPNA